MKRHSFIPNKYVAVGVPSARPAVAQNARSAQAAEDLRTIRAQRRSVIQLPASADHAAGGRGPHYEPDEDEDGDDDEN